jgi:hypothetical protein
MRPASLCLVSDAHIFDEGGTAVSSTHAATVDGPSTGAQQSSGVEQVKDKAQDTAQQAAGKAKNAFHSQVDQRSTDAGHRVSTVAADARSVSQHLRQQGREQPARWADQAAERVESLGDYLQRADGDRILRDVEDFGRRQPWAVMAGGLALGFLASRFLKASSERRSREVVTRWEDRRMQSAPMLEGEGIGANDGLVA